jgi:hypothetical protein
MKKIKVAAIGNENASNNAKLAAADATEAANELARLAIVGVELTRFLIALPMAIPQKKSVNNAATPTTPVSMANPRYWLSKIR